MTPPGEADAETLSLILARFGPLKSAGQTARANEFLCRRIVWDLL